MQARLCQLSCSETLSWTSEPIVVCAVLRFQSRTCWQRFNRGIVRCSCFCGDSVTDIVVLNMTNLDSRFSESMVRDVHVAKDGSSSSQYAFGYFIGRLPSRKHSLSFIVASCQQIRRTDFFLSSDLEMLAG